MRRKEGVSLENGFTQIANELLEAICKMPSVGMPGRFLLAIIRLTYGYRSKERALSRSLIKKIMGLKSNDTFEKVRQFTHDANIVLHRNCGQRRKAVYKVNKSYTGWGGKNLARVYIGKGGKPCPKTSVITGNTKETLKKRKKEGEFVTKNGKTEIHIHNTLFQSALKANPNKDPLRLKNDAEALERLGDG